MSDRTRPEGPNGENVTAEERPATPEEDARAERLFEEYGDEEQPFR